MPKGNRTAVHVSVPLSPYQVRRLAAEAMANPGTVYRAYYAPEKVRPSTLHRLTNAARELGYAQPPTPRADLS